MLSRVSYVSPVLVYYAFRVCKEPISGGSVSCWVTLNMTELTSNTSNSKSVGVCGIGMEHQKHALEIDIAGCKGIVL